MVSKGDEKLAGEAVAVMPSETEKDAFIAALDSKTGNAHLYAPPYDFDQLIPLLRQPSLQRLFLEGPFLEPCVAHALVLEFNVCKAKKLLLWKCRIAAQPLSALISSFGSLTEFHYLYDVWGVNERIDLRLDILDWKVALDRHRNSLVDLDLDVRVPQEPFPEGDTVDKRSATSFSEYHALKTFGARLADVTYAASTAESWLDNLPPNME
ncbi:hypothetical protein BDV95DRAFT_591615 [Massariosphaeria phaeospora]|uniref:Uncharacterized protein n=1 Tax=Massariosphaeria phaeospora TaxID=100035 RepID=A0A7C8MJJ0_9PLEO|nr:hypothetical protein BDV95DRAFT_591615 [Massariosphaeria phaeospora]